MIEKSNSEKLKLKFEELLKGHPFFTVEEVFQSKEADEKILKETSSKAFSLSLPFSLLEKMREIIKEDPFQFEEEMRAHIFLRYCNEKQLAGKETLEQMNAAGIISDKYRYRFAKQLAERNCKDLCEEISAFEIQNEASIKKVAEIVLCSDPNQLFLSLSEFFQEDEIREEFYLRGLIRSSDALRNLRDDSHFEERLSAFPPSVLKWIYQEFKFGKKMIQTAMQQVQGYTEDEIFVLFVTKSPPELQHLGFNDGDGVFIDWLRDEEQLSFFALILFLNAIKQPPSWVCNNPVALQFLKEINAFKDPSLRFAATGLALWQIKQNLPIDKIVSHVNENFVKENQKIFALILTLCENLCQEINAAPLMVKKVER